MMEDEIFQQPRRHELKGSLLIWNCILRHLSQRGERQISILKVKAHVQIDKVSNPFERWAAWCNDFVDKKAKSTITADNRGLFLKLEAMHKRVSQHRTDAIALFEFIALASDKCIKASAKQQKERQKDNHFNPEHPALQVAPQVFRVNHSFTHQQYLAYPWGPVYLWRITQWAKGLAWPSQDCVHNADISMLELYIDYMTVTQTIVPRNTFTKQQRDQWTAPCYILEDKEVLADTCARTLGAQMMIWSKSISWIVKHAPFTLFPASLTSKARSLSALGCSSTCKGFAKRPQLWYTDEVKAALHNLFNTSNGSTRHLNRIFIPPKKPARLDDDPMELQIPFTERAKFIRYATRYYPLNN